MFLPIVNPPLLELEPHTAVTLIVYNYTGCVNEFIASNSLRSNSQIKKEEKSFILPICIL